MTSTTRTKEIELARESDEAIAAAWAAYWAAIAPADQLDTKLAEARRILKRRPDAPYYAKRITELDEQIAAIYAAAEPLRLAALNLDAKLYTGWQRFFLVEHIHSSQRCSSFRPTTRIGWLPKVSGLTEAEAVAEYGAALCTICFPSAPVELTRAQPDGSCSGSGSFVNRELPNRTGFYSGNWGTCPDCGQRVTIVGQNGIKLRKHKA
jgi:hypothetical protein